MMEYYENVAHYAVMNSKGEWYDARHENDFGWFPCVKRVYDVPTTDPEMFAEWLWTSSDVNDLSHMDDLKIQLASSGFYGCHHEGHCSNSVEAPKEVMHTKLNNAPPSFKGNVVKMNPGIHHYMCTRKGFESLITNESLAYFLIEQILNFLKKQRVHQPTPERNHHCPLT